MTIIYCYIYRIAWVFFNAFNNITPTLPIGSVFPWRQGCGGFWAGTASRTIQVARASYHSHLSTGTKSLWRQRVYEFMSGAGLITALARPFRPRLYLVQSNPAWPNLILRTPLPNMTLLCFFFVAFQSSTCFVVLAINEGDTSRTAENMANVWFFIWQI